MSFKFANHTLKNTAMALATAAFVLSCTEAEEIQPGPRFTLDGQYVQAGNVVGAGEALSLEPASTRDWPQHLGNTRHLVPNASLSTTPRLVASVNLGIQSRNPVYGASKPIIVGNTIYHYDADGKLHAISASGAKIWTISLVPGGSALGDGYGGGLAYANGVIYAATGYGEVVAVDANTGGIFWRFKQSAPLRVAPMVSNGKVYLISKGVQAVALNAGNGAQAWRQYSAQSNIPSRLSSGVPASQASQVVLGYASGEMQMVNSSSGTVNWSIKNISDYFTGSKSSLGDITCDPVIVNGRIIAATNSGIIAVSLSSGEVLWANNIGSKGPLSVSGNSIFGVTEDARVFRVSLNSGQTIWAKALPRSLNPKNYFSRKLFHYDARLVNNQIWVADQRGGLRRFDAQTGGLLALDEIPEISATPVFGSGMMVAVSSNGQLLIFR